MLTIAELKLLGEYVDATLAAGLIRTAEGASGAARVVGILQREVAVVVAAENAEAADRRRAALDEVARLKAVAAAAEAAEAAKKIGSSERLVGVDEALQYQRAVDETPSLKFQKRPPTPCQIDLLPVEQACGGQSPQIGNDLSLCTT